MDSADALQQALDVPGMMANFHSLLHLLPHQRFHGGLRNSCNLVLDLAVLLSRGRIRYHEMEKSGLRGDADTVLAWDDIVLVLEFKTGTYASARSAQHQIHSKAYLRSLTARFRLYLGLSLYTADREVVSWECQGYSSRGEPIGAPLTHEDVWPAHKADVYGRWT